MEEENNPGILLKARRIELGLTMREFAAKYNMSAAVLNQLEKGKIKYPSMKTLYAIADALEFPINTVCALYSITANNNEEDADKSSEEQSPKQKLISALLSYNVPDDKVETIIDYIDFVKEKDENSILNRKTKMKRHFN